MLSTTASMMSRAGRRVPEAPAAVRCGGMALLGRSESVISITEQIRTRLASHTPLCAQVFRCRSASFAPEGGSYKVATRAMHRLEHYGRRG